MNGLVIEEKHLNVHLIPCDVSFYCLNYKFKGKIYINHKLMMSKRSPVAIFLAASTIMASAAISNNVNAGDGKYGGGLKEWNTDQSVEEKSKLDKDAKKAKKKAKDNDVCIPIGEGENCW